MRTYAVIACFGCAVLLAASVLDAQIYRWVDEDGVIHYSDTPHEGAEEIELPESTPAPPPRASFDRAERSPDGGEQEDSQPFDYESLTIAQPAPEETLWNIEGTLNVRLNLQPALRPGDRVRVYYDGEPQPVSGLRFELQEVWRGAHNLQAEVTNEAGQLMVRSEPIRFYVHQTSIANPN